MKSGHRLIHASSSSSSSLSQRVTTVDMRRGDHHLSQLGVIELVDEYTELYLLAHALLNGTLCCQHTALFRFYVQRTCLLTSNIAIFTAHQRSMAILLSACPYVTRCHSSSRHKATWEHTDSSFHRPHTNPRRQAYRPIKHYNFTYRRSYSSCSVWCRGKVNRDH